MTTSRPPARRVVVIGGGYTGMVAAWRLARQHGHEVVLLERSAHLGGLAGDFTILGASLEKAYHHLFHTDAAILALVRELGLEPQLQWLPSSVALRYDGKTYSLATPLDVLRFTPCPWFSRIRLGLVLLYLKHRTSWRPLVRHTALAWMRRACGAAATRVIWEPLLRAKFGRHFDRVSMAWLWARLHIRANSRTSATDGEQLGYFRGGFATLTRRLEAELVASGVRIRRETTVQRIDRSDGQLAITCGDGDHETCDAALFTGSCGAFARLLTDSAPAIAAYRQRLTSVPYLGATCLVFASDQQLGDHYWINLNEADAPFLVFIRHTRLVSPEIFGGRHIYYLGAYQEMDSVGFTMPPDELRTQWFAYVQRMFPAFDPARVVEHHLFRFRDAQHVVDPDYESRRPGYVTPVPGLFLANFSQIFPEDRGTNFAVREGNQIAELIARSHAGVTRAETPRRRPVRRAPVATP